MNDALDAVVEDGMDDVIDDRVEDAVVELPQDAFLGQPDPAEALAIPAPTGTSRAGLEALIAAQRFDEAEKLFAALPESLAAEEWYPQAGLRLAQRVNDEARLLRHAAQLRKIAPHVPKGYGIASFVLRLQGRTTEAEQIAAAGANGDFALAFERWEALRGLTPKSPEPLLGAARLAIRRGQPGEARRHLLKAVAAFPEDRAVLTLAARTAVTMLLWDEAAKHWQTLQRRYPDSPEIALEAAASFIGPRRGRNHRLPGVLAQFDAMHERFPDFVPAYAKHLRALREANRLDDAEVLGAAWLDRFPDNAALAIAYARVAEDRGYPGEAAARLAAVRALTTVTPRLEANYIRALSLAGQNAFAEDICAAALERFPGDFNVIEQYLALATRNGDFAEASRRATQVLTQFPEHPALRRLAERIRALDEAKMVDPPRTATDAPAARPVTSSAGRGPGGCRPPARHIGDDAPGPVPGANRHVHGRGRRDWRRHRHPAMAQPVRASRRMARPPVRACAGCRRIALNLSASLRCTAAIRFGGRHQDRSLAP
jgi:tetratricopeptide (TPR) repeat protein